MQEFVRYCVIIATQLMGKKIFEYDYRVVTICCVLAAWSIGVLSCPIVLTPVVQTLDSAIHRINHYPADSERVGES